MSLGAIVSSEITVAFNVVHYPLLIYYNYHFL